MYMSFTVTPGWWSSCPYILSSIFNTGSSMVWKKTYLLNDVVRRRIQFGFLQRRSKRLHMSFVGYQLEFIVLFEKRSLHTSVMQQTFSLNVPNYIIHNTLCMLMLHNAHLDSINVCFSIFLTLINFVFVFLNLLQQFLFKKKKKFKVKSWA